MISYCLLDNGVFQWKDMILVHKKLIYFLESDFQGNNLIYYENVTVEVYRLCKERVWASIEKVRKTWLKR